jgi:hypothetical protein
MRLACAATAALALGALLAACGGGGRPSGLNNPDTLASAIRDSAQHQLDAGTSGLAAGTKVTQVHCVNTRRFDFTCDVRFNAGGDRTVTATVAPGGRSYVVTSGDL